jgi:PKHD-type hydroxylase
MSRFSVAVEEAFNAAECEAISALGDATPAASAPVWRELGYAVDADARNARTTLRVRDAETGWLFDRLDTLFARAGADLGLAVGPLSEPVQILRYDMGGHFQRWHTDGGLDRIDKRLISVSVELSDVADYDGGTLEIVPDLVGRPRTVPRGGAIFFPSRALHRVTPVTRGTRRALVAWTGA